MTSTLKRLRLADELLTLPADQRCELIKRVVVFLAPANYQHGRIAAKIGAYLTLHVDENNLGEVYAIRSAR